MLPFRRVVGVCALRAGGYGFRQPNPEIRFCQSRGGYGFRERANRDFYTSKLLGAES